MNNVNCDFCGSDNTKLVNEGADLLLNLPGEFRLVECQVCGLIYQNPQLTAQELGFHYPSNYLPFKTEEQTQESIGEKASSQHSFMRQFKRIDKRKPTPGLLLDVGCATGAFLQGMQNQGWQVKGVEPNKFAANYAQEAFNLEVFPGTLEEAAFPNETFDVITLWDVLEHVHQPTKTLEEIHRILKPEGLLVISLPNPSSIEAQLFGDYWVGWERPRHLFLFKPALIEAYLAKTGFTLDGIESFNGRLSLTLLSIEFLCKAKNISEHQWRPWLKIMYNWPLRLLTFPLYWLVERFNKASIMTIFATRTTTHRPPSSTHDQAHANLGHRSL